MSLHRALVLSLSSVLAVVGCGGSGSPDNPDAPEPAIDAPPAMAVALQFAGKVGGAAFACGQTYTNLGSPVADYMVQDFRLFVHDVKLITADGARVPVTLDQDGAFQRDTLALLDFEDGGAGCPAGTAATHTSITGSVTPGTYNGVELKVGVPEAMNHLDASTATPPLDDTTMWWVWRAGYKFIRIDGMTNGTVGWPFHLGATGCPGSTPTAPPSSACTNENVPLVTLTGFDPTTTTLVVDIAALLASSNLATGAGCHSNPTTAECGPPFAQLGLPFGSSTAGTQSFIHAP